MTNLHRQWTDLLDERQRKEIAFAQLYATNDFRHGTDGHNRLLLIASLVEMLDRAEREGVDIRKMYTPKDAKNEQS